VFKSYYNLTQGATDDLVLKPTDIMLNDEQDFEQIKLKINKFYKTFKEKFEKEFKTQLNSATKTKDLSNMITSFIFDYVFDRSLENTKELAPI